MKNLSFPKTKLPKSDVIAFAISAFALLCLVLSGCAPLTTGQQKSINQFEQVAVDVAPLVASYAASDKVNYAQAIPVALDSVAVFDPSISPSVSTISSTITNAVNAFTNGTGKTTGQKIAGAVLSALPANPTGSQVNAAIVQAGVGASTGANP